MTRSPQTWTLKALGIITILLGSSFSTQAAENATIQSILPDSGITSPGTKVKVRGTGFLPGTIIYFDGVQARQNNFISVTELEVETPYLRPGKHLLQIATVAGTTRSEVEFLALPSDADSQIDKAIEIARQGKIDEAVSALEHIGKTNSDYQVRAAAYYAESQIFFDQGDFFNWSRAAALIYLDGSKSGMAVQTFWPYRLAIAQSHYLFDEEPRPRFDLWLADKLIDFDVTQAPEPRFYRALLNARSGNVAKARIDSDFVSKAWPNRSSAAALAAYVAALSGDTRPLRAMTSGHIPTDATSLALLGEGLFLTGDSANANKFWARAGEVSPSEASMAFLAAKKHMASSQKTTGKALFAECAAMAPTSKDAQAAREALSHFEQ